MKRVNNRQTVPHIEHEDGFLTHNQTIRGEVDPGFVYATGRLPDGWRKVLPNDARYVVWSYVTPIAWVTRDGLFVIPAVKYSPTTSNHQGLVRQAWRGKDIVTEVPS